MSKVLQAINTYTSGGELGDPSLSGCKLLLKYLYFSKYLLLWTISNWVAAVKCFMGTLRSSIENPSLLLNCFSTLYKQIKIAVTGQIAQDLQLWLHLYSTL